MKLKILLLLVLIINSTLISTFTVIKESKRFKKITSRRHKRVKGNGEDDDGSLFVEFFLAMLASADIPGISTVVEYFNTVKDVATEVIEYEGNSVKCDKEGFRTYYAQKLKEYAKDMEKKVSSAVDEIGAVAQNLDSTGDLAVELLGTNNFRGQCKVVKKKFEKQVKDKKTEKKNADSALAKFNDKKAKAKDPSAYLASNFDESERLTKAVQVAEDGLVALKTVSNIDEIDCSKLPENEINAEGKVSFFKKVGAALGALKMVWNCSKKTQMIVAITTTIIAQIVSIILSIFTSGIWKIIKMAYSAISMLYYIGKALIVEDKKDKAASWGSAVGNGIAIVKDLLIGRKRKHKFRKHKH